LDEGGFPAIGGPMRIDDPRRLAALHGLGLLDAPAEVAFDRLTRLAATLLDAPVALVTLIDRDRQFFASSLGLPEPLVATRETPLSHSFCQHTIGASVPLVIADARVHPLVRDNLAIPDMGVIAYLGIPLAGSDRQPLGSFCVIATKPRQWTARDVAILTDLAASVITEMELRGALREAQEAQRALEEARRAAEHARAQLSLVVDQMPVGVILVASPSGRILEYSAQSEAILGHPVIPVTGVSDYGVYGGLHADGRPYAAHDYPTARALRGERVIAEETRYLRGDGREAVLSISAIPLNDASWESALVVCAFTDITVLREQERARADVFDELAHDIKNPLASIRGQAQLMQRQIARQGAIETDQLVERLGGIVAATGRARALLDEHLDLARVRAGQLLQLERTRTDLVTLADRTIALQQQATERHRLRLLTPLTTLSGDIDGQRIERAFVNLLSNAIKYSPNGGEIAVRLSGEEREDGPWATIAVADQGIGIPPADLARIGERFHRAGNVVGRFEGTGLGMASVRQVVAAHSGSVAVESVEGMGTTVIVRIPLGVGVGRES